ncbi:MAG: T9SS type A sorting domain-containing protein [Saprospiraceae bacterium]|nr:T9SS type A sorting domain-containing protein [Saprospiraceae bacterium]
MNAILRSAFLSIIFVFCLASFTHAQEVQDKQMSLVVKKTATWCSNCGSWGWQWFKELIEDTDGDAYTIALHSTSSQLKPPMDLDGSLLAHFTGNGGFPTFFVNSVAGSNYNALVNAVTAASTQDPIAGLGILTGYENGEIACQGKVEFFEPYAGELFVGYYIIEDSLVFGQTAQGPNAIHRFVLRDAMEAKPFGNGMTLDVQPGESVLFSSVQAYPASALDRLSLLGVIWTYANGKYSYLNSWMEPVVNAPLSSLEQNNHFSGTRSFPNPAAAGQSVTLELPASVQGLVNVSLIQNDGRILQRDVIQAENRQEITLPESLAPGSYFLRLQQGESRHTLPLTIQK